MPEQIAIHDDTIGVTLDDTYVNTHNLFFVYCVRNPNHGISLYKIGYTNNIFRRIRDFNRETFIPGRIIWLKDILIVDNLDDARRIENEIHTILAIYREPRTEFFRRHINFIRAIFETIRINNNILNVHVTYDDTDDDTRNVRNIRVDNMILYGNTTPRDNIGDNIGDTTENNNEDIITHLRETHPIMPKKYYNDIIHSTLYGSILLAKNHNINVPLFTTNIIDRHYNGVDNCLLTRKLDVRSLESVIFYIEQAHALPPYKSNGNGNLHAALNKWIRPRLII